MLPLAAGVLAATALVFGTATAGQADPKPSRSSLKKQLAGLEKKVDRLIADYNAKRVELTKARTAEQAARDRLTRAEADYDAMKRSVEDFASRQYQMSGPMPVPDLTTSALVYQMQQEQSLRLSRFDEARTERQRAAEAAKDLTDRLKSQASVVDDQREQAEKLIDEIKDKLDKLVPVAPGKRPGGSWAPELPTGADNITPRTLLMRTEVAENFDLRFPVGCYRSESSGEHPLGRACDFMMSSGGSMPTPEMKALGDAVAAWAIKNGSKLGVKYVIWRQQIYNLGWPGWRTMADRGGITANHYDHVHISMY
ncbi:coiled-coil domain-containing protein [Sphaerimonospora thailandensis]|uniref:ARB-07466-like C-terminal domain-containing protein n=1 Tax=Sphaerimonospora thailandensis TaxID=795644 RepID=A0A8J3RG35_9ACTN|nr:hypothetical protein [Sphaerimonospora thailandensis]GIH71728.1 hypothetical protein Mth01_39810 [Sphaerimonospora thailandensis]